MKLALAIAALASALALPVAATAHGGYHWTENKAENVIYRDDLRDDGRAVIIVAGVSCSGFGHQFTAWNGHQVYSKFTCTVEAANGRLRCVEISLKGPRSPYSFAWQFIDRYWCGY
jgi:hypothetical protein